MALLRISLYPFLDTDALWLIRRYIEKVAFDWPVREKAKEIYK
jgi:hypothetical protein